MTGFVPPEDPRLQKDKMEMIRVRGKEFPGSFKELKDTDPDKENGDFVISFRSTAVDVRDTIEVINGDSYVVRNLYDPYKSSSDRSMKGKFLNAVVVRKGE